MICEVLLVRFVSAFIVFLFTVSITIIPSLLIKPSLLIAIGFVAFYSLYFIQRKNVEDLSLYFYDLSRDTFIVLALTLQFLFFVTFAYRKYLLDGEIFSPGLKSISYFLFALMFSPFLKERDGFHSVYKYYVLLVFTVSIGGILSSILINLNLVHASDWIVNINEWTNGSIRRDAGIKGFYSMPYYMGLVLSGHLKYSMFGISLFRSSGVSHEPISAVYFITPAMFLVERVFESKRKALFVFGVILGFHFLCLSLAGFTALFATILCLIYFNKIPGKKALLTSMLVGLYFIIIYMFLGNKDNLFYDKIIRSPMGLFRATPLYIFDVTGVKYFNYPNMIEVSLEVLMSIFFFAHEVIVIMVSLLLLKNERYRGIACSTLFLSIINFKGLSVQGYSFPLYIFLSIILLISFFDLKRYSLKRLAQRIAV